MKTNQPAFVEITPYTLIRYVEADEEVEERLGLSPGAEFLTSLAIEHEDPMNLIDVFIEIIVQNVRETAVAR